MKKYINLIKRGEGKTTNALYEFSKDYKNSIFVSFDNKSSDYKSKMINFGKNNFISADFISDKLRGKRIGKLILDDFFDYTSKQRMDIYLLVKQNYHCINDVYVFSSYEKGLDYDLIEIIKIYKKRGFSCPDTFGQLKAKNKYSIQEIEELYYSFFTDDDSILIDEEVFFN